MIAIFHCLKDLETHIVQLLFPLRYDAAIWFISSPQVLSYYDLMKCKQKYTGLFYKSRYRSEVNFLYIIQILVCNICYSYG